MKKLFSVLIILNFCFSSFAQQKKQPLDPTTAGGQLQIGAKHYYRGLTTTLITAGLAGILIAGSGGDSDAITMGSVIGGVGALIGTIMILESWSHIKKAGQLMDNKSAYLSPSRTGIGIAINF